jgi:hypothetical protein
MCAFLLAKSQSVPLTKEPDTAKTFLVQLKNGKKSDFGYLAGINDSALQIAHKRVGLLSSLREGSPYKTYYYQNIETLGIGKYGSVGQGFAGGALAGFGAGGLMGVVLSSSNSFVGAGAIIILGVIGAIPGTIIGGLLGSHKRKFNIKRNKENFEAMKTAVVKMANDNDTLVTHSAIIK